LFNDSSDITYSIMVGILEASGVYLINNTFFPPFF